MPPTPAEAESIGEVSHVTGTSCSHFLLVQGQRGCLPWGSVQAKSIVLLVFSGFGPRRTWHAILFSVVS